MKKLLIALLCLFSIANVNAANVNLTVDGGWQRFYFDEAGISWEDTFSFTLTEQALFTVTDAYESGDEFSFTDGTTTWNTSTAILGAINLNDDFDAALASIKFSSLSVLLGAGSYTISGLTTLSPFGSGSAGVQLSSVDVSAVPIPAAALLFAPALLGFMGLRRKVKNTVV